jgi:hypothetical protein
MNVGIQASRPRTTTTGMNCTLDLAALTGLAAEMGYIVTSADSYHQELAHSIMTRMRTRGGQKIAQNAAFNIPGFPRQALEMALPPGMAQEDSPRQLTYSATTVPQVEQMLRPLLVKWCKSMQGVTRPLIKPSESVIRVVATLMPPVQIQWVRLASGMDWLYVNMMYVLADQLGEMHALKDAANRELALSQATSQAMRQLILGCASSGGRWRRGGGDSSGMIRWRRGVAEGYPR